MTDYKYIIKLGKKKVWEGAHPPKRFIEKLTKKHPNEQISISWVDLSGDVLIAKIRI